MNGPDAAPPREVLDNRCPWCVERLEASIDEGADGPGVESANDKLEHGGHFVGCPGYKASPPSDAARLP